MSFFDAHCHVQEERALTQARAEGVMGLACCGTGPCDWDAVSALAKRHGGCRPQYGLHP